MNKIYLAVMLPLLTLNLNASQHKPQPLKSPTPHLVTREQMIDLLPKNGIVAEVGVAEGAFSPKIFAIAKPKKLYLIDCWQAQDPSTHPGNMILTQEVFDEYYAMVKNRFLNNERVEVIKAFSPEVCSQFPDEYFDWVYIDADHSYLSVKKDVMGWWPKVKKGGFICGDDYGYYYGYEFGIIQAVNEFIQENNLTLKYLTQHCEKLPNWAIQKPLD